MNVLWHKVWHDLWQNKSRTLLTIFSIAAGIFAVGAIFGMVDQLLSGMDAAHQEVSPSHINIFLREFIDKETADSLTEIEGVLRVDPVNQIPVRYKTKANGEWELGTLVMRPDYEQQTYDEMVLKEGAWPDGKSVGIERLSSQYYEVDLGQELIFEIEGSEVAFPVNGLIRHPFVPPPQFGGQAHFFTDSEGLAEFGIPEGRFGQLLIRVDPYSLEYAQEITGDIRAFLGDQGIGVAVTIYQSPSEHWGRMFVEGINLVLQIMAVVALFMSVILVFNAMTALITQQTNQIGIIKAAGGQRRTIIQIYLAGVFVFGLLALLIALPLAALFAFLMSQWFLNLFNVDLVTFSISTRAVVLQITAALLVPLLAALFPVLRGAGISVREAIASYGIGADFGSSHFDRAVEGLGAALLPSSYAAALGNIFRRKGRLILTLVVLVVGGAMFLIVMSLIASTNATLDNEMARQQYDIRLGFVREQSPDEVLALLEESGIGTEAEMWFARNATILREGERIQDSAGWGAQLLGIPSGSEMYRPIITNGRWLQPDEAEGVVISEETAENNNISVGDTIKLDLGDLGSTNWEVVGTFRVVYGVGFVTEPIYAPLESVLEQTGQDRAGTQLLITTGLETMDENIAAADELRDLYEDSGLDIDLYVTTVKLEERAFADNQFASIISLLLSLAMLVATVGGIGLMGALGISVVERTREIGVMRAIGAKSRTIMGLFMMEGILQGLISWLIAVPLAALFAQPLARQLGQTMIEVDLDFAFSWTAVIIWLVTILVIALTASILPARRAAKISVQESLAYS